MPNRLARFSALAAASLLVACLALSWAWPRVSAASSAGQKASAPKPGSRGKGNAATASAQASSLPGTMSLLAYYKPSNFSTGGDDPPLDDSGAYISTYNLPLGLESVVGRPRQNGNFARAKPRLSPDGKKIVYAAMGEDGYNLDVYVMNADGSNPVNLSNYPSDPTAIYNCRFDDFRELSSNIYRGLDSEPAWSPDGQHIAFVSGRNGHADLYVMRRTART